MSSRFVLDPVVTHCLLSSRFGFHVDFLVYPKLMFFNMDKHPIIRRTLQKRLPGFAEEELHKSDREHNKQHNNNIKKQNHFNRTLFVMTLASIGSSCEATDNYNNTITIATSKQPIKTNNDNIELPNWAVVILLMYLFMHIIKDTVAFINVFVQCFKHVTNCWNNCNISVCGICCCSRRAITTQPQTTTTIAELRQQLDDLLSRHIFITKYGRSFHCDAACGYLNQSETKQSYGPCTYCLNKSRKQQRTLLSFLEEHHSKQE